MKHTLIHHKGEGGQAIILIALLLTILIASVGLAIDGGGMYLLHRDVQNATDAAALSGAYALCTANEGGGSMSLDNIERTVRRSIESNGFTGADATITIESPVTAANTSNPNILANPEQYIFIEIAIEKPSYFIQVLYDGPLIVRSSTISRCDPGFELPWPEGSAIITLSPGCAASGGNTSPVRVTGNGALETVNGGIYSNSSNCGQGGFRAVGNGDIEAGGFGACTQGSSMDPSGVSASQGGSLSTDCPGPQIPWPSDPLVDAGLLAPPTCGGAQTLTTGTNSPGTYASFDTNNGTYTLEPGIYCITDSDVSWKGVLQGDGVFLYFDGTDRIKNTGNSAYQDLSGIIDNSSPYNGMLAWVNDPSGTIANQSVIEYVGQSGSKLIGMIYAPRKHCNLAGGGSTQIYGQWVCYSFDGNGGSDTIVHYQESVSFEDPAAFSLTE